MSVLLARERQRAGDGMGKRQTRIGGGRCREGGREGEPQREIEAGGREWERVEEEREMGRDYAPRSEGGEMSTGRVSLSHESLT